MTAVALIRPSSLAVEAMMLCRTYGTLEHLHNLLTKRTSPACTLASACTIPPLPHQAIQALFEFQTLMVDDPEKLE